MGKLGFYYDISRCIGCRACQVACKEENKLLSGQFFRRVDTIRDNNGSWIHFSGACNHCEEPACTAVCPTGAMYKAEDGTVRHRNDLCVGCGKCVHHCPYGAPSLNDITGYSQKCDSCAARRSEERNPACVDACPVRALRFGDLDVLQARYGGRPCEDIVFLPAKTETKPTTVICTGSRIAPDTQPSWGQTSGDECILAESEVTAENGTTEGKSLPGGKAFRILILGTGAAAVSAAEAAREADPRAEITMVGREKGFSYCRPMLSKGSFRYFPEDCFPIISEEWIRENDINFMPGREIEVLDPGTKSVTLQGGARLFYDRCIYALGMHCWAPPISGSDMAGVYMLRDMKDMRDIRVRMLRAKRAVIIGGGITGLETAWEMKRAGIEVTVLEAAPQLMGRILDAASADRICRALAEGGVKIVTGASIECIHEGTTVKEVRLQDGTAFPADLVLISTGYRSNDSIAVKAGAQADRGIVTDCRMRTTLPDVYACGDCINLGAPNWAHSRATGRIAGHNACGGSEEFKDMPEPALVHTAGTSMLSIGDMGKQPETAYTQLFAEQSEEDWRFLVNPHTKARCHTWYSIYLTDGKVCGITMIGSLRDMEMVRQAVTENWEEARLRQELEEKGAVIK